MSRKRKLEDLQLRLSGVYARRTFCFDRSQIER